jgi:hypothetical protein
MSSKKNNNIKQSEQQSSNIEQEKQQRWAKGAISSNIEQKEQQSNSIEQQTKGVARAWARSVKQGLKQTN